MDSTSLSIGFNSSLCICHYFFCTVKDLFHWFAPILACKISCQPSFLENLTNTAFNKTGLNAACVTVSHCLCIG